MRGYAQPIGHKPSPPITIREEKYWIDWLDYDRTATKRELDSFTKGVLKTFKTLRLASRKTVTLDKEFGEKQLKELAEWGNRAYRRFFSKEAREELLYSFRDSSERPTPTFISEEFLFPWEVLYEQQIGQKMTLDHAESFWGVGYAPARMLEKRRRRFVREQALPLDMIYCLHDELKAAHRVERPALERRLRAGKGRFRLLGPILEPVNVCDGKSFLNYLAQARHNMIHFACHCVDEDEVDTLLLSLIHESQSDDKTTSIELKTYHFLDVEPIFQRPPLVFLNACKSAGGTTSLQQTFNLPREFVKCQAAAVIATACPVPDLFAAEFAKHFYELFLGGKAVQDQTRRIPIPIGEALRQTRHYFLSEHHNPLGLAYGLYSPAHYRLAQIPADVGE